METQVPENEATAVHGTVGLLLDGGQDDVMVDGDDPDDDENDDAVNGGHFGQPMPLAAPVQPGDAVLIVGRRKYPISSQTTTFALPPALRQLSIAVLWSILKSGKSPHLTKIRAIETLVRIDQQSLASERQEDWREVQSASSGRSNVRILAELSRNKANPSKAKSLPNKPPKAPKLPKVNQKP